MYLDLIKNPFDIQNRQTNVLVKMQILLSPHLPERVFIVVVAHSKALQESWRPKIICIIPVFLSPKA